MTKLSPRGFLAKILLLGSALLIAGCAGSGSTSPYGSNQGTVTLPSHNIAIVNGASNLGSGAFDPNPFTVSLSSGGKVTWANGDVGSSGTYGTPGISHHLVSDVPLFDTGLIEPQGSAQVTFTVAGTYRYHCSIHPSMVGTVVVTQ